MPNGIKPRDAKLMAIMSASPPTNVKSIRSFVGLCNFFQNHIQNFSIIAAPLFKLTCQDSGYTSGTLPAPAFQAFQKLQSLLSLEPMLAFPRANRDYALITNATSPTKDMPSMPRGLSATLAQTDKDSQIHVISHTSRQLKENKKTTHPFYWREWTTSMNTLKDPNLRSMQILHPFQPWGLYKRKL